MVAALMRKWRDASEFEGDWRYLSVDTWFLDKLNTQRGLHTDPEDEMIAMIDGEDREEDAGLGFSIWDLASKHLTVKEFAIVWGIMVEGKSFRALAKERDRALGTISNTYSVALKKMKPILVEAMQQAQGTTQGSHEQGEEIPLTPKEEDNGCK
jgi:hypothetical protein